MKIAVVGTGLIGALHARIFHADPRCTLVAVCDTDPARARTLAADLGCRAYSDHAEMFAAEDLDAASIATPETARHDPSLAGAQKGLSLMLEKPLGRTLADVDRLIADLGAAGGPAPAVNFILHAEPRFERMKQLVAEGALGRLVSIFARRRGTRAGIEKYAPWTDLLSSTLIHDIEMTLAINPSPPQRVYAEAVIRECADYGSHDAVVATLRFEDGTVAVFETSWVLPTTQPAPLDPAFHVIGDRGGVTIEGADRGMTVLGAEGFSRPDLTHWPIGPAGQVGGALAGSLQGFITRTLAGTPHPVGLAEARAAEAVVAAMKRSIAEERPVRIDELE